MCKWLVGPGRYLFWWKYLWKWLVGPQTATQSYLFWWKYLWMWFVGSISHRLQPYSHHHATYCGESTCESGLSVHNSHRLKAQSYFHATYLSGSICKCGLSVHDSHRLKAQSYLHATYSGGSICESGLWVHNRRRTLSSLFIKYSFFPPVFKPLTSNSAFRCATFILLNSIPLTSMAIHVVSFSFSIAVLHETRREEHAIEVVISIWVIIDVLEVD